MKIFVTGGAGFIGSRVCRRLVARGDDVVVLVRPDSASAAIVTGATSVLGKLEDADVLQRMAQSADAVLHLALTPGPEGGKIDRAAIGAFRSALDGSGKIFVHTSAAGIIGDTQGEVFDEKCEPRPAPPVRWRADNERFALDAAAHGVRVCAIRPAPIVHDATHSGSVVDAMRTAAKTGPVPFVDGGTRRWSTVHVDDVADLYIAALERGAPGEAYFAASDEFVTNKQLAETIAAGREMRALDIAQARKVFTFFADLALVDIMVSSAKARNDLGWAPSGTTLLQELVGQA